MRDLPKRRRLCLRSRRHHQRWRRQSRHALGGTTVPLACRRSPRLHFKQAGTRARRRRSRALHGSCVPVRDIPASSALYQQGKRRSTACQNALASDELNEGFDRLQASQRCGRCWCRTVGPTATPLGVTRRFIAALWGPCLFIRLGPVKKTASPPLSAIDGAGDTILNGGDIKLTLPSLVATRPRLEGVAPMRTTCCWGRRPTCYNELWLSSFPPPSDTLDALSALENPQATCSARSAWDARPDSDVICGSSTPRCRLELVRCCAPASRAGRLFGRPSTSCRNVTHQPYRLATIRRHRDRFMPPESKTEHRSSTCWFSRARR